MSILFNKNFCYDTKTFRYHTRVMILKTRQLRAGLWAQMFRWRFCLRGQQGLSGISKEQKVIRNVLPGKSKSDLLHGRVWAAMLSEQQRWREVRWVGGCQKVEDMPLDFFLIFLDFFLILLHFFNEDEKWGGWVSESGGHATGFLLIFYISTWFFYISSWLFCISSMRMRSEKSGCQKVEDMPLHHITSIRSAGISMYYTHTHTS